VKLKKLFILFQIAFAGLCLAHDSNHSDDKATQALAAAANLEAKIANMKLNEQKYTYNPAQEQALEGKKIIGDTYRQIGEDSNSAPNIDIAHYKLQPEDVIDIRVYGDSGLSDSVTIGKDGWINVAHAGIIKAAGKTILDLEQELKKMFIEKMRLRDPRVAVVLKSYRPIVASTIGAIRSPGDYSLRSGSTILTLVSQAGGVPQDGTADLRRCTLKKKNSNELIPIDLYALIIDGDINQNYTVEDGDQLIVPFELRNRIFVDGAIGSPGVYPFTEKMRIVDAIALARGQIPYQSVMDKIVVIREKVAQSGQYDRININLKKFFLKNDGSQNILLQPGDIIHVPLNPFDIGRIGSLVGAAITVTQVANLF
jgi:polysaccharide export outer membrane protein